MPSVRARNLVLVALVLAPVGVLAGLSLSTVDAYRAEVGARMRTDLSIMQGMVDRYARSLIADDAADARRRARETAEVVARFLPFEPAHAVLDGAGQVWSGRASSALVLTLQRRDPAIAPPAVRLRVLDGRGRTVVPARFDPDAPPESDRERLLDDLRRRADQALFGDRDLAAAKQVWTDARARFGDDALRALADVEGAWLEMRATPDRATAEHGFAALQRVWPQAVLLSVGRTWVLLALAASGEGSDASGTLKRLDGEGALETIPLTDEERDRLEHVTRGAISPSGAYEPFTAPLPAGATLVVRRLLPDAPSMGEILLEGVRRVWPPAMAQPRMRVEREDRRVSHFSNGPDFMRWLELPLPGGASTTVVLVHPESGALNQSIVDRKRWTIAGIAALLVLVALGLHLTLRALRREREARRLKDDFLANVSHELRTPLTSVCLHADLLAEGPLPDAQRRSHAEVVRAEGARLSALVDDLLDFAARERGARRLEPAPVDVGRAVTRALEPFRVLAEREGVQLTVDTGLAGGEVAALADPLAIERILANLLGNAWKHGRPSRDGAPGRIRVTATPNGDGAEVTVRDDGPGIPEQERGALFERFHRGASAAKTRGVGLGLALSRDLARAMGGDLVVVEDPTETVFRLTLPPVPPAPPETSGGTRP